MGGYWGHSIRMGSVGAPSTEYRRIHEATVGQHRAAAAQIGPGRGAQLIQIEAERYAAESLPGSSKHPMRSRQGHFLGLDYAEKPTPLAFPQPANWAALSPQAPGEVILRSGMVLEVHTMLGMAGAGFGFIGDIYVVREDGPERLTGFPQDLFVA